MRELNVAIIGCGNIAGDLDLHRDSCFKYPLTHAGAYKADGRFRVTACLDSNPDKASNFASSWNIPNKYIDMHSFVENEMADVISICSPTQTHLQILNNIIEMRKKPKLIFCEKPLSTNYKEAQEFVSKCKDNGIILAVNYTRRWDPVVINFKKDIEQGKYGELVAISGVYNKGVFNNGSHMIDLINFLFAQPKVVFSSNPRYDFFEDDPSISTILSLGGADVSLVATDARDYSIFEMSFFFSKAEISMKKSGFVWHYRKPQSSDVAKGYKELFEDHKEGDGYIKAMRNSINNIYAAIRGNDKLLSDGDSALLAHKICHEIRGLSMDKNNAQEIFCGSSS